MTLTSLSPERATTRRDASSHLFAIGDAVRMKGHFSSAPPTPAEIFRVTATLPPRDGSPQYRIRNDDERHERMASQDNLELVGASPADEQSTLVERTFGHGKGSKAQQ